MLRHARCASVLALAALVLSAPEGRAQSAREIMDTALQKYQQQTEGIQAYTITQEVMGTTISHRFVKREVEGHEVFVPAEDTLSGRLPQGWGNPYQMFPALAERASLEGTTPLDGQPTWILKVKDFSGLDLQSMTPEGARGEFEPDSITLYVGQDGHLLRGLSMEGRMAAGDSTRPIGVQANFRDYRQIDGMMHPFVMDVSVRGMDAALTPAERRAARQQLQALEKKMEQMSDQQRQMMENMMGPQLKKLRQMLESGSMETTIRVKSVEVERG